MNTGGPPSHRSSDDPPPPAGIWRFLVRLSGSGQPQWAGSVHTLDVQRGGSVVVDTATGRWLAEVLRVVPPAASDATAAPLSGEVLRIADADDHLAAARAAEQALRLRDQASAWLDQQRAGEGASAIVLSADVSLDQRVGVVAVLGTTDPRFGRAAAELADRVQLQRVQWVTVDQPASAAGAADAARAVPEAGLVMTPEQADDELFWQRFWLTVRDGRSLGRQHRVAAGNRGLYLQKTRGSVPDGRRMPPGRSWMIRVRTAAGGIAPGQLDQLIQIARQFGDGTLRLTMRQAIQLHGVLPAEAPEAMRRLQQAALFAAGSCGNAPRNLTCCALPPRSAAEQLARRTAVRLAADLLPRGSAFEFHFDDPADGPATAGWQTPQSACDVGRLPHKWKVGVTHEGHNCVDVLTNDLAIVVHDPFRAPRGQPVQAASSSATDADGAGAAAAQPMADVYVGGSTAYLPQRPESLARLAGWLGRVPVGDVTAVVGAALDVFRHSGGEGPRHQQRWKYAVERLGIDAVAEQIQAAGQGRFALRRSGAPPAEIAAVQSHSGQWRQANGRFAFARSIPGGRLRATGDAAAALRRLAALAGSIRVGARHTLVLADVAAADRQETTDLLDQVAGSLPLDAMAIACPALPSCPLAIAAAETDRLRWQQALYAAAAAARVAPPELAISGCANGCSHPLTTAVGVVAETAHSWRVFLGGDGRRMGVAVATVDGWQQFAAVMQQWLTEFAAQRDADQPLSDWFWRRQPG